MSVYHCEVLHLKQLLGVLTSLQLDRLVSAGSSRGQNY